jgi:hypothetical protein
MARQQATLNTHSRYLHEGVVEFAERLAALHGPQIESVILTCSGTEANEVALRMATGRRGIVCTNAAYHGNSELVGSLTRLGQQPSANPAARSPRSTGRLPGMSASPSSVMPIRKNSVTLSPVSRPPTEVSRRWSSARFSQMRGSPRAGRLHATGRCDGAGSWRFGDRRRGSGRLRAHGELVGL